MATYKKIVVEDSSGHIAQTSALSDKATVLARASDFSATGDVATARAVSFDGSGAVALTLAIGADRILNSHLSDGSVNPEQFSDGSGGNTGNGTNGQFLKTDGSGGMSWATMTPPNNNTITLTAGAGLSGGGDFTVDQSSDEAISFALDSNVAGDGLAYDSGVLKLDANVAGTGIAHERGVLSLDSAIGGTGLTYRDGVLNVDASQAITSVTGDFAIAGDLTVTGKTITTATETLEIADNTMLLNSDLSGSTAVDTGIVANRADASGDKYKHLFWDESKGAWAIGSDDSSSAFPASSDALMINFQSAGAPSSGGVVGGMIYDSSNGEMYLRTA